MPSTRGQKDISWGLPDIVIKSNRFLKVLNLKAQIVWTRNSLPPQFNDLSYSFFGSNQKMILCGFWKLVSRVYFMQSASSTTGMPRNKWMRASVHPLLCTRDYFLKQLWFFLWHNLIRLCKPGRQVLNVCMITSVPVKACSIYPEFFSTAGCEADCLRLPKCRLSILWVFAEFILHDARYFKTSEERWRWLQTRSFICTLYQRIFGESSCDEHHESPMQCSRSQGISPPPVLGKLGNGDSWACMAPELHKVVGKVAVSFWVVCSSNATVAWLQCLQCRCQGVYHQTLSSWMALFSYLTLFAQT